MDTPPEGAIWEAFGFSIHGAYRVAEEDEKITELPEPRAYQVLSRKAMLLAFAGLRAKPHIAALLAEDPFSVGLYCSSEKGPGDLKVAREMIGKAPEEFAAVYKSNRSPKRFFKEIANIPVSQLGMFLGVTGPHLAFTNSSWACIHALEQAEMDLETGAIRAALVCGAFAIEDPIAVLRLRRKLPPGASMVEGAVALLLVADGTTTDWLSMRRPFNGFSFGTADDLMQIAMEVQIR
jgi:hypothetical protein